MAEPAGVSGLRETEASVEPPKGGILARTAAGAGWMFAWRMTSRVLGLASTLILVRLLAPEDFGLFGLAFAVIATLEATVSVGVEAQIVRAKETSRALYDTVFTIALLRGTSLALLMLIFAAPAAAFFNDPRLEAVMQVLALYPLLAGFSNVGTMEYGRHLNFRMVFRLLIMPRLMQIPATLGAAVLLQSYWALVIGVLAARVLATTLTYLYHPYRPRLGLKMWRELIGISLWTWVLSVAMAVRDRTATFAIGRVLGSHELGVYTVSAEIASLPTSEIAGPISQAAMPGLAAALRSGDPGAASDAFLRIFGSTLLIALPAAIGISAVSGPVVAMVLGQRWIETVPLIAILGATWFGYSISLIGIALLDAQARLRRLALFVLSGIVIRGTAVGALAPLYGLNGLAAGLGVAFLLEAALMTSWCLGFLGIRFRRLAQVLWRPAASVAIMAALLWGLGLGWNPAPPDPLAAAIEAGLAVPVGVLGYVGSLGVLWWLAGRPAGGETDLLGVVRRILPAWVGPRLLGAPRASR